jgi:hypothetical protein
VFGLQTHCTAIGVQPRQNADHSSAGFWSVAINSTCWAASSALARGFSPAQRQGFFVIFSTVWIRQRIHLPQVTAAQELQIKAEARLASLMEEKLVTRISSIYLARRRQNDRTTSRPHFDWNAQNVTGLRSNGRRQSEK